MNAIAQSLSLSPNNFTTLIVICQEKSTVISARLTQYRRLPQKATTAMKRLQKFNFHPAGQCREYASTRLSIRPPNRCRTPETATTNFTDKVTASFVGKCPRIKRQCSALENARVRRPASRAKALMQVSIGAATKAQMPQFRDDASRMQKSRRQLKRLGVKSKTRKSVKQYARWRH